MGTETGSISIKEGGVYYTLYFSSRGWLAADMVQYLDDILTSQERGQAILRLLGFTLQMSRRRPPRTARHWVEVDLARKVISTNSDFIRQALGQKIPEPQEPYSPVALRRVHEFLDRHDFTVRLYR